MITIYTDGATEEHNGKLGTVTHCGIGVFCPDREFAFSKRIKAISNNEAEFWALIIAMEWAIENGERNVEFKLDSDIVVRRANGNRPKKAKYKNERMDKLQDQVLALVQRFNNVKFTWIPREENMHADVLSKQSLYLKQN